MTVLRTKIMLKTYYYIRINDQWRIILGNATDAECFDKFSMTIISRNKQKFTALLVTSKGTKTRCGLMLLDMPSTW